MPGSPTDSRPPTTVAGGTGTTPTPANNIGGGAGWGDRSFHKGGMNDVLNEGKGHVDVRSLFISLSNDSKEDINLIFWYLAQ